MSILLQTFSFIIFVALLSIFFEKRNELKQKIGFLEEEPIKLAVGVLSSRENFLNRENGRETWLKEHLLSNSNSVKVWFILGNSSCDIPPNYRLSQYGCEKWILNATGLKENFFTLKETLPENCRSGKEELVYQGFTFKVNQPLVVRKLGILSHVFKKSTDVKVAIMDIHSKEIIVQASIFGNSSSINGYLYVPVESILFPKDYEGLILFEGYMQHSVCSSLIWDDGGGVITFKKIYTSPFHHDSMPFTSKVFSVVSIGFFVHNIENLNKIVKEEAAVTNEWKLHLKEIQKKIDFESSHHKDLLILDLVDTYRNLPLKLLKFYKWLNLNKKFLCVLKTDDDSVVNTEIILKKLQEDSKFEPEKFWLWSRFRRDWPVNLIGKWADDDYQSSYYPSFPCGAAYILSKQVVEWLSLNSDSLYPYQGEDVSHGIWLSAINPVLIDDQSFECNTDCNKNSYNRAQLQPDQIGKVWSSFKKCKNLCVCND